MKLNEKSLALICAVFIVALELVALLKGIDGIALSLAVACLAGLGGYTVRKFF